MQTYVISNGRRYSDHEVLFVEVEDRLAYLVPLFIDFCKRNQGDIYGVPSVMGITYDTISWRAPNSSLSVLQFIDQIANCVCDEDAETELQEIRRRAE